MKTTFLKSLLKSCLSLFITVTAAAQCTAVIYPAQTSTCSAVTFSAGNFNGLYTWDFGDGSTATYTTNALVYHYYYPTSGTYYNVTLSLYSGTNTATPCSTASQTVAVNCTFTNTCQSAFNTTITSNCYQVKFKNQSSLPGSAAYYVWDFGDGNTTTASSNNSLIHTYTATGSYVASLSIYTSTASSTPCSISTQTVSVSCATCQALYTTTTNTASCNQVSFSNQSTGGASHYVYDFGDGYTATTYTNNTILHTYASSNTTYTTSLTVYNSSSTSPCSVSYQPLTINCGTYTPCAAAFSMSSYSTNCSMVQFINTSYTPGTSSYSKWEFGNGQSATVSTNFSNGSVGYVYPANGIYTATLSIYSSTASTTPCSSTTRTLSINCGTGCAAAFSAVNNYTASCMTYTFTNTSTVAGPGGFYQWQFGDGGVGNIGSTANVQHTYSANGVYTATLSAYSSTASTTPCSTATQTLTVNCSTVATCHAAFTAVNNYTASCHTYTFVNTSTVSGPGVLYQWDFGDGVFFNTTSNANLSHTYLSNGAYTATLGVYSNSTSVVACSYAAHSFTVSCPTSSCQASSQFTLFPDTANPGNYFAYNASTGSGALSYLWNFGDGNTSTQQYPFHQYATPGQYVVCLQVTSTSGTTSCTDMYCDSSSVHRIASGYIMKSITGVSQSPTGIAEVSNIRSLRAYPNPLSDELTIELDLNAPANAMSYELANALGEVVLKDVMPGSKTTINTGSLDHGFYFLSLKDENGKMMKSIKLIK